MQKYLELKQKNDHPEYLMVMFHGLGSSGSDLINLAPYFQDTFPQIYFYSPDGPEECDFGNFGYQWFSLQNKDNESIQNEIIRNADKIVQNIKSKLEELNLNESKLILLGFSQGTMLSLFLGLSHKLKPAGIIWFSGKLILPDNFSKELIDFPICLIHGMKDDVLDYAELKIAEEFLTKNDIQNEIFGVPNLSHTIDLSGIGFAKNFISSKIINKN